MFIFEKKQKYKVKVASNHTYAKQFNGYFTRKKHGTSP